MKELFTSICKTNAEIVDEIFAGESVRNDHYNGSNGINRFCAHYQLKTEDISEIDELKTKLYKLSVIPTRILVFDGFIELEWSPNNKALQVVSSKEQYKNLALDFGKFLDEVNTIKGLIVNTGSFYDDPDDFDIYCSYRTANRTPKFISDFGQVGIEVIDFRTD